MTADHTIPSDPNPEPGPRADVEEIQADIDRTRHELGQTVDALSAKADVKGRAQHKMADARAHLIEGTGSVQKSVPLTVAVTVVVIIGFLLWHRRR